MKAFITEIEKRKAKNPTHISLKKQVKMKTKQKHCMDMHAYSI